MSSREFEQGGRPQDNNEQERRLVREPDRDSSLATDEERDRDFRARQFVKESIAEWTTCKEAEYTQRKRSWEEVKFNSGDHWDSNDRKAREDKDMVVIEINRTPQYLNQVANEQRMTRPSILVKPVGDGADPKTAQIKQGLIRSIERRSDAEAIRDDAFYGVLEKGWAHYRTNIDWVNERSFKREISAGRIWNDFSVYTDPAAIEFDRSDARFRFIIDDLPMSEYKRLYPKSKAATLSLESLGDVPREWISKDTVRIAEKFYKKFSKEKLYALADDPMGDGKFEDELEQDEEGRLMGVAYIGDEPLFRWSWRVKIMWCKFNAVEVLDGEQPPDDLSEEEKENFIRTEGREYEPGAKFIPILTVLGRRILVEDKYIYVGMVRDAMAPCLAADYWLSAITEMVALGSKAPWIVAWESINQWTDMWDTANTENYSALYYNSRDANGKDLPQPQRNSYESPIQAMTFILRFAEEDLKRVMGIYNAALGAPGPESSGVAIGARQRESDVANFNYIDNLKRTIKHEGRIYLNLIPLVMSEAQMAEIVRMDGKSERVWLNKAFMKGGEEHKYVMGEGYDADVEVGPSYNTKRQEAAAVMTEFVKADPTVAPLVSDLIADQMDFPNREQFVKRLRSRVPPGLLEEEGDDQPKIPPQFQAQYEQTVKQLEIVTKALEEVTARIESEQLKYQHERELKSVELASKENMENKKIAAQLAGMASKEDMFALEQKFKAFEKTVERSSEQIGKVGTTETESQTA